MWIYLLVSLPTPSVKWNDAMLPLPKKHLQFSTASKNGTLLLTTASTYYDGCWISYTLS